MNDADWTSAAGRLAELVPGTRVVTEFGQARAVVAPAGWREAATLARDSPDIAATFFDVLTATECDDGIIEVTCHVWAPEQRRHLLLMTAVSGAGGLATDPPRLASLAGVYPGAAWHEREAWEGFGVVFDDHPGLAPLLLDAETAARHPLRKQVLLAGRAAPWPGAGEPGGGTRRRRAPGQPADPGRADAQPGGGGGGSS